MASLSESPGIKLKYKKQRLGTNFAKCIKCQTIRKGVKLQNGMSASIKKFIEFAIARNDEVYQRLQPDITGNTFSTDNVKWHKTCYSSYTSKHNLEHVTSVDLPGEEATTSACTFDQE